VIKECYSVAMVRDGWVYGVLYYEDGKIKRAWIDPEATAGVYAKMVYRGSREDVWRNMQVVLDVRPIPEVNPEDYSFNTLFGIN
jgi:hypothetical protein